MKSVVMTRLCSSPRAAHSSSIVLTVFLFCFIILHLLLFDIISIFCIFHDRSGYTWIDPDTLGLSKWLAC